MPTTQDILQARELMQNSSYAIALTGAGVSTPSGIPDFRSPGSGLWEQVDALEVASIFAFRSRPEAFYDWIRPSVRLIRDAHPNPAHVALAEMERLGVLQAIITQNIDGLHLRAGSRRVIELHGNVRSATCIDCYRVTPAEAVLAPVLLEDSVPTCQKCGGVLKPNAILFGEQLPFAELLASRQEAQRCDLMLVAGSSLTVEPAAYLPELAKQHAARLILVNLGATHLDSVADLVIHADVAEVLPRLAEGLRQTQ